MEQTQTSQQSYKSNKTKHLQVNSLALLFLIISPSYSYAETTALKDNPVQISSDFSNFYILDMRINVPSYPLQGEFRFLKIFDDHDNVLFLGKVSATQAFNLPLQVLKTSQRLTIELFSEDIADQTIVINKQISQGELL